MIYYTFLRECYCIFSNWVMKTPPPTGRFIESTLTINRYKIILVRRWSYIMINFIVSSEITLFLSIFFWWETFVYFSTTFALYYNIIITTCLSRYNCHCSVHRNARSIVRNISMIYRNKNVSEMNFLWLNNMYIYISMRS